MRNVVQQSFVVFTIGEKSYTVVYQKYMKENVVSSEISIQNKAEMSFQMKRHRTYFRTRTTGLPIIVKANKESKIKKDIFFILIKLIKINKLKYVLCNAYLYLTGSYLVMSLSYLLAKELTLPQGFQKNEISNFFI